MYKDTLSGVLLALIVRKKFLSVNSFTLALLLMLLTNIRYDHNIENDDDSETHERFCGEERRPAEASKEEMKR